MLFFKNLFNDKKLVSDDRQERPIETKDIKNDANLKINLYNDKDCKYNDEGEEEEMNNYDEEEYEEVVIPPIINLQEAIVCTCDEGETKVAIRKDKIFYLEEEEDTDNYKKKNTEIYFDDSTGNECSVTVDQSFDEVRKAVWGYENHNELMLDNKTKTI